MFRTLMGIFNNDERKAQRALYMLVILLESHSEVWAWDDGSDKEIYFTLLDAIREEHKG